MANITAADVRNRLRVLTSVEIPDSLLETTPYIPTGDIWLNKVLEKNSKSFTGLTDNDKGLAKAAEIAFVAQRVISSAPTREHVAGPIKIKPIPANDKKEMIDILNKEINDYLYLIDCYIRPYSFKGKALSL